MHEPFTTACKLVGRRARMVFDDGQVVVATLHSATTDMDGSLHLVYKKVESTSKSPEGEDGRYFYSQGETLVAIEPIAERA